MAKKRVYRKRKFSRKKKVFRKRKSSLPRLVKKLIFRNLETKQFDLYRENIPIYPWNNVNSAASTIPVSPNLTYLAITQGTGQQQRIGNVINLTTLRLKFLITPNPYHATTNPFPMPLNVGLYLWVSKNQPLDIPSLASTNIIQLGNSSTSFTGRVVDEMANWNTDLFTLYYRKFFKVGYAQSAAIGTSGNNEYFANNDYKLSVKGSVNMLKYAIKRVKFDDNITQATTRGLFMSWVVHRPDGTLLPTTTVPCGVTQSIVCRFKDA